MVEGKNVIFVFMRFLIGLCCIVLFLFSFCAGVYSFVMWDEKLAIFSILGFYMLKVLWGMCEVIETVFAGVNKENKGKEV